MATKTTVELVTTNNGLVKAEWMDVTPEIAREWLLKNPRNRVMRQRWVNELVRIIQAGDWLPSTDAIGFDTNGDLINGQHRLTAIAESGVTVRLLVAQDLHPDAFEVIDRPIRRSTADSLHILGESNTLVLAATLKFIDKWEHGRLGVYEKGKNTPTTTEMVEILERHPDVREWVSNMSRTWGYRKRPSVRKMYGSAAAPSFCWYAFSTKDNAQAYEFLEQVETGANLDVGMGAYELRERLLDMRERRGDHDQIMNIALTIKGWNAYRTGKEIKVLSWKPSVEVFPEIV